MKNLTIPLNTIDDMRAEIQFLNNVRINSYMGFRGKNQIIMNITLNNGLIYLITYKFKTSKGGGLYSKFHRYLRQREWGLI